ncbi:8352_t:CDS:2, partial [Gigaspora rosea]
QTPAIRFKTIMLACKTVNLFYGWEGGNALTSPNLSWNGLEEIFHKTTNDLIIFNFIAKMVNANEWLNKKIPAEQREQVTRKIDLSLAVHTPPEGKMSPFSISHYGFGVAGSTEGDSVNIVAIRIEITILMLQIIAFIMSFWKE